MTRVVAFWTFDLLHSWHEYYLNCAKKYWNELVVIVARDENVKKIKWRYPYNNEKVRLKNLKKLWIASSVRLWYLANPYLLIKRLSPDILCFGYDQQSFNNDKLRLFLNLNWVKYKSIIINSYKPKIYKSSIIRKNLEH